MASPAAKPARVAIDEFIRDLADRGLSSTTQRIRRRFLQEYLQHAEQAAGSELTVAQLLEPERGDAWLEDAAAGKTRTRNTLRGPSAAAYRNSMRVRVDSYNGFASFVGMPDRRDTQAPTRGDWVTPGEADRLLDELAARRPLYASAATSLRTAAVAALVAETGKSVPELADLQVSALHLEAPARLDLEGTAYPLGRRTVHVLSRWLSARAAIIAELEGSDPGHLWIPVKPGRARTSSLPAKPGLSPAAVRTLHHAHRTLVRQVFGTPLRPGALRAPVTPESEPGAPAPAREH
jgi:integrase